MHSSSRQLRYGAIISYVAILLNILIGLVYTPWMIKSIGKGDYGLYTLAMSIISIFIFDFGLSSAVTKFVANHIANGTKTMIGKLLGIVYKLYICIDAFLLLILSLVYFIIPVIYKGLSPDELDKFKVIFVIAATFSVISFPFIPFNGVLSAFEKFIQLKLCELAHKIITVVLMSWCLFKGWGLYALVIINAISGITVILLKWYIIATQTSIKIDWNYWDKSMLKAILGFSGWVTVIALCQRMIFNLAPSVLGSMSNASSIAIFGIAATLEGYVYTFASALGGLFLPRVSRLVSNGDETSLNDLMIKVGRLQIYIITFIILGFIAVGRNFITLWIGDSYFEVYICAIILMIPSFLYLPMEVANTTVIVKDKVKAQSKVFLFMALVNLLLSVPLSKYFGAQGMCISILVAYLCRTIGMNIVYKRELNIDLVGFYRKTFLSLLLPICLLVVVSFTLNFVKIFPENIYGFCLSALSYVVIFTLVFWTMGLNGNEKELVFSLVSPIYKRNRKS